MMAKAKVLIVEDEEKQRELLDMNFGDVYDLVAVATGEAGLERLVAEPYHAVVLDMKLPGMDGLAVIDRARALDGPPPIIVTTAFASVDSAVQAMKRGAYDYLTKPFALDDMARVLARAVARARLEEENRNLRAQLTRRYGPASLIGEHPTFRRVVDQALQVAETAVPVLIQGESGTGKELVARLIHAHSPRAAGPFLTLNCAAIPEELLESELFGHEQGAFTGATQAKPGLFEAADTGTLFLDEIGDMKVALQAKLLRALEQQEVTRLGSTRPRSVSVRILAASNQPLARRVEERKFRQDLYYRLHVVALHLPPLRERPEDLPLLIDHFLAKHGRGEHWRVEEAALAALRTYRFPGNARELENALQGAMVLARDRCVRVTDLPPAVQGTPLAMAMPAVPRTNAELKAARTRLKVEAVRELEVAFCRRALAEAAGNVSEAARRTGMPRRQLHRLLERHGLAARPAPPGTASSDSGYGTE